MQQRFLFADLIAYSTCFGHHYAHHQEIKSIIRWLLPVVFRAVVFKLLVWCGAEGYASGLQHPANRTHDDGHGDARNMLSKQ